MADIINMANTENRKSKKKRRTWRNVLIIAGVFVLTVGAVFAGLIVYGNIQMQKIPGMTFEECLEYTLKDNEEGIITVGIIKDGEASYTVYGNNAAILPQELHAYEIGSLTKTVTAAMIQNAVADGKIELDKTIDNYLELSNKGSYPTVRRLLTHTSGLKPYYFESPMTGNFFAGRNDFYGIGDSMILNRLSKISLNNAEYPFEYSNFGYATLGLILEKVYATEYTYFANRFIQDKLGLVNTHIADGREELDGKLKNAWDWQAGDTYLAAGGLISNIEDMLTYAQIQLEDQSIFAECHKVLSEINATSGSNKMMNINMDSIGMAWITDKKNGIIWHNGGTGDYNSYIGFIPAEQTAVVILSNLKPNYRIPATVMGVKLLTAEL